MRLFVALDLPLEVKDCMFGLQRRLKTSAAKLKLVSKKHMHFTVKFLGDSDKVDEIVERLSKIKKRRVMVKLSRVGFFPDKGDVRVVWLGVEPEEELNKLAQEVDGELLDLFPGEQRFSSHLTLGRVKAVRKKEDFLKLLGGIEVEPLEFEFSWLKLYKSVRKGSTHEYVCLKEF